MNKVKRFSIFSVVALLSMTCFLGFGLLRKSRTVSAAEPQNKIAEVADAENPMAIYSGYTSYNAMVTYNFFQNNRSYNSVLLGANVSDLYDGNAFILDTVVENFSDWSCYAYYCVIPAPHSTSAVNTLSYFTSYNTRNDVRSPIYGSLEPTYAASKHSVIGYYVNTTMNANRIYNSYVDLTSVDKIYVSIAFYGKVFDTEVEVGIGNSVTLRCNVSDTITMSSFTTDFDIMVSYTGISVRPSTNITLDQVQNMIAFAV